MNCLIFQVFIWISVIDKHTLIEPKNNTAKYPMTYRLERVKQQKSFDSMSQTVLVVLPVLKRTYMKYFKSFE